MIASLLVAAILLHWDIVAVNTGSFAGEHSVPLPAVIVLVLLSFAGAILWKAGRIRLLSRAELLCVVFSMIIALPLMTQGFWHRFIGITSTLTEEPAMFDYLGHYPEKLWPHGPNLLDGAFEPDRRNSVETSGNVQWRQVAISPESSVSAPVLTNASPEDVATVRIRVPRMRDGEKQFTPGEPFVVTALARPGEGPDFNLPARSYYYCRIYSDVGELFSEALATGAPGRVSFAQQEGFRFLGSSATALPATAADEVIVEFALVGEGRVIFASPTMMSNDALLSAFRGKRLVTQSQYDQLAPSDRAGLVVKPDNMLSWAGITFLLSGYIPVRQWLSPVFWWTAIVLLILLASFAMNVLLRKQWMENERYQMPLTRVPLALMGYDFNDPKPELELFGPLPPIWRNKIMWFGFALGLLWTLMRAWNYYNPKVPDLDFFFRLKPYFNDPKYGNMWNNVYFLVSGFMVSLAMFMELNVLLSIVVGFFAYQSLYWLGESTGWRIYSGYPFGSELQTGSYIMYAVLILFFIRKYLWKVFKAAVTGDREASAGEAVSYRTALVIFVLSFVGAAVWAGLVGVSQTGVLYLFGFLVITALIASKLRTECGAPFGYLGPNTAIIVLAMFGGVGAFGVETFIFGIIIGFIVGQTPFFLIPGAQMEFIELARRIRVQPRHLTATVVIGLLGGMLIGGWVFLAACYGEGGRNLNNSWPINKKPWAYNAFHSNLASASANLIQQESSESAGDGRGGLQPRDWGYVAGGGAMAVVAICRQFFPAFWFHPIGILLGSNTVGQMIWASCLIAWILRMIVLKLGGARTVRNKLQPCFVGVFMGTLAAHLLTLAHAAWLQSQGVERVLSWWPYLIP